LNLYGRSPGTTVAFVVWENGMTRPPWGDEADVPPGSSFALGGLSVANSAP
jgi:hypothetical protein